MPWRVPLLAFCLTLLVTAILLVSVARSVDAKDRASFESEVDRTADAVRERLDTTVTLMQGVAGLFAGSERVTRSEFRSYVGELRLRERYPGIQGIGYSERIAPDQLAQRQAEIATDGSPGFHVWPEEPRPEYHAIVYLEPSDARNVAAIGYDMFTEPVRREAMARARDEAAPAASGRVVLVQEIDEQKQAGFLIYLPLYASSGATGATGGRMPATIGQRRERLQGFVYAPLRVEDLLRGVRGTGVRQVDLEIFDGPQPKPENLLRSTSRGQAAPARFVSTRTLNVAGRTWLLRFGSLPAFEDLSQRRLLPWLAVVSLAGAALLAWITLAQARARREAEELAAERREADRRKDEFLAVLAHELRNPLAPLGTSVEILRRVPEGPMAQRALDVMQRQLRHMVRLIDDLLDVSRISRDKIVLQKQRVRLAAALDAAVETSLPLIQARGHELVRGPVDPAWELDADPTRLAQVFTNLLNNAANYTPPGGRIALDATATPAEVRVCVRDNGIGIAPDKLRQVFQLFVQADRPQAGGGLGIGLSLAARLAEMHGGRIECRSAGLGQGAEFTVVLPRPPAPRAAGG